MDGIFLTSHMHLIHLMSGGHAPEGISLETVLDVIRKSFLKLIQKPYRESN